MIVNDLLQALVAQIYVFLDSLIINDLLQSLGLPKNISIWSLWSSMISYKASVQKYVSFLDSMIVNDLLQSLSRPKMFFIW